MKKILEIGGGRTPYIVRYRIPWAPGDHLTVIDMDEENLEMAKKAIGRHAAAGYVVPESPAFVLSDASRLDISDESMDEVVLSNTLSAPIHHDWDRDGTKLTKENKSRKLERDIKEPGDFRDPFYIERKKLLDEALRVLRTGGRLSIYTDLIIYGQHSYEKILLELKTDPFLQYAYDPGEARRIDLFNEEKLGSKEFCCCFRAEILPRSEVYRFTKM